MDIKESNNITKCEQCGRERTAITKIYGLDIRGNSVSICSSCLANLESMVHEVLEMENTAMIPNIRASQYDRENEPVLARLFNIKVSGAWTDEHQAVFEGIDFGMLCNSNRVLYRQIKNWD